MKVKFEREEEQKILTVSNTVFKGRNGKIGTKKSKI